MFGNRIFCLYIFGSSSRSHTALLYHLQDSYLQLDIFAFSKFYIFKHHLFVLGPTAVVVFVAIVVRVSSRIVFRPMSYVFPNSLAILFICWFNCIVELWLRSLFIISPVDFAFPLAPFTFNRSNWSCSRRCFWLVSVLDSLQPGIQLFFVVFMRFLAFQELQRMALCTYFTMLGHIQKIHGWSSHFSPVSEPSSNEHLPFPMSISFD